MTRDRWLLAPAVLAALLLNLLLVAAAALVARERPVDLPALNPVPVTLTTVRQPETAAETPPPEPPPPPPSEPPRPAFTPDLGLPSLGRPDPGAVKVALDPSLLSGRLPLGDFVFSQTDLDEPPRALARTTPPYPFKARQRGIEGFVEVKLLVKEDGSVGSVDIVRSEPPGVFDEAALQAVPHWTFTPGRIEGRAVPSWVITRVVFTMGDH